jgi:hypothetical protein
MLPLPLPAADTRLPADVSAATVLLALPAAGTRMPADVRLPADDSAGTVLLPLLPWRCAAGAGARCAIVGLVAGSTLLGCSVGAKVMECFGGGR